MTVVEIEDQQQKVEAAPSPPTGGRHSRTTRLLIGAGVVALVLLIWWGTATMRSSDVPDFAATTLNGSAIRLNDYHGQVVMLNFWATWCPPCRSEMPAIQRAYERYHDQGFTVLAINDAEQPSLIQPFADSLSLSFPIVLDPESRLQDAFAINGYPTSFFIDPKGHLYATHSGMLSETQLINYIQTGLSVGVVR